MSVSPIIKQAPIRDVQELVADSQGLISLPDVYLRLREIMDSPESSMEDVAKVIALDPALTARLLRIANSAIYNFPSQVETLSRAASILGLRQIHDLVLATSVAKAFAGMPNELMDMKTFWYRCVYRGFLAKEIGEAANFRGQESLFVRALLLDIGHLILYYRFPSECRQALAEGGGDFDTQLAIEREGIGCDALTLGAELLRAWALPNSMIQTFECLTDPAAADQQAKAVAIVHIAAYVTHAVDTDLLLQQVIERFNPAIWGIVGVLPTRVHELVESASGDLLEAMYQVFASTS